MDDILIEDLQEMKKKRGRIRIAVVGVGGGGNNVVDRMMKTRLDDIVYINLNTDAAVLDESLADHTLILGEELTEGLGAGADPQVGKDAAEQSKNEIKELLQDINLLFIACGLGGGTGTGASPVVAEIARELNILTIAVVTTPFEFEGPMRAETANEGMHKLKNKVDSLMVIENEKVLGVNQSDQSFISSFILIDDVLREAIEGICSLILNRGIINLDFADFRTVIKESGNAMITQGSGEKVGRGLKAVQSALDSPMLKEVKLQGATGVIINITADAEFPLLDAQEAASTIEKQLEKKAKVLFGLVVDKTLSNRVIITLIATGLDIGKSPEKTHELNSHSQSYPPQSQNLIPTPENNSSINPTDQHSFGISSSQNLEEKIPQAHDNKIESVKNSTPTDYSSYKENEKFEKNNTAMSENAIGEELELTLEDVQVKRVEDTPYQPNDLDSNSRNDLEKPAYLRKP